MSETSAVAGKPSLDATLPSVTLRLGGKDRHLVFDFNAITQAEKLTGINLLKTRISFFALSASEMRGLLYAALIAEDPELTLEQVGKLLHIGNVTIVNSALAEAWLQSVPEDERPASPKKKAQRPTSAS